MDDDELNRQIKEAQLRQLKRYDGAAQLGKTLILIACIFFGAILLTMLVVGLVTGIQQLNSYS